MDGQHPAQRTANVPAPESSKPIPPPSKPLFTRCSTPSSISKGRSKTKRIPARRMSECHRIDTRRVDSRRNDSSDLGHHGPILVFDSNSRPIDADLMDALARLEGHEQRICLIVGNMHNEMTKCANFMLECISIHLKKVVENEKSKIPQIEKLRETQRAANVHLQELQGGKR